MNAVWNSYGQLCGCPEIFKKSCKFFCRELDIRVPENVATELWQKNRIRVCSIFFEDFIITISHHTAECFVEVSLILNIPVTVDKNKVVIAVHSTLTADFSLRLKLSLH